MPIRTLLLAVSLTLSLTHCMSYDFSRRVVQQGNLLPPEKLTRLKLGMSKNDAAILMGTSLMSPTFTNDRWDYAFTTRKGNNPTMMNTVTLFFKNDRLVRVEHKS